MRRAIPVSVHGDAVPVVRVGKPGSASLECLSLQSLLAEGTTLRVKLLMFSMFESNKVLHMCFAVPNTLHHYTHTFLPQLNYCLPSA